MRKIFSFSAQYKRLRARWKTMPRFARHVLSNMAVGLGIALFLIVFHSGQLLRGVEDAGIDWMMRIYRGVPHSTNVVPYVFLDVDEAAYRAWGEPLVTPRDKLATLIQYAVDGDACAVIVDIDLTRRFNDADDQVLIDYLEGGANLENDSGAAGTRHTAVPVIFARLFRSGNLADSSKNFVPRISFIDTQIAQRKSLYWASPLFDMEHDRVIRHWRLWETSCRENDASVIPSIQLLAHVLAQEGPGGAGKLEQILRRTSTLACEGKSDESANDEKSDNVNDSDVISIAGLSLHATSEAIHRRIFYSMPWHLGPGEIRPSVSFNGQQVPLISVRSAHQISDTEQAPDSKWIAGRIVVIGASYADGRDIYATPIGSMPGALILINAIDSLARYGEMFPPSAWVKLLIEAFLILIMSLAFARFHSFWGMLISASVVIGSLLPLSFIVFRSGLWLDFVIPLIAVLLHHLAAEYEETKRSKSLGSK